MELGGSVGEDLEDELRGFLVGATVGVDELQVVRGGHGGDPTRECGRGLGVGGCQAYICKPEGGVVRDEPGGFHRLVELE